MTVSVFAISTSPRRHGNSESALDAVLSYLPNDWIAEKAVLNDLDVKPCKGCGVCEKSGECIQKDDFSAVAEKIRLCDVLILASPVYSMSVCAQAKALIDRCQVFWSEKYVLKSFKCGAGKVGLFISTAGQMRDDIFVHTIPVARFLFDVTGISAKNTGLLLLRGLDAKDDFKNSLNAQETARDAAEKLILSVKNIINKECLE